MPLEFVVPSFTVSLPSTRTEFTEIFRKFSHSRFVNHLLSNVRNTPDQPLLTNIGTAVMLTTEQNLHKIVLARRADEDSKQLVRQGGTTQPGRFCVSPTEKKTCQAKQIKAFIQTINGETKPSLLTDEQQKQAIAFAKIDKETAAVLTPEERSVIRQLTLNRSKTLLRRDSAVITEYKDWINEERDAADIKNQRFFDFLDSSLLDYKDQLKKQEFHEIQKSLMDYSDASYVPFSQSEKNIFPWWKFIFNRSLSEHGICQGICEVAITNREQDISFATLIQQWYQDPRTLIPAIQRQAAGVSLDPGAMGKNYQIEQSHSPHYVDQLLSSIMWIEENTQLVFLPNKNYIASLKKQTGHLAQEEKKLEAVYGGTLEDGGKWSKIKIKLMNIEKKLAKLNNQEEIIDSEIEITQNQDILDQIVALPPKLKTIRIYKLIDLTFKDRSRHAVLATLYPSLLKLPD